MVRNIPFHIVDVFGKTSYSGNQLAVFFSDGFNIDDKEMQQIAREINFAETTFVLKNNPNEDRSWSVRIFTPERELPFAGHPTLGTAYIIRKVFAPSASRITLDVKAGKIPVSIVQEGDQEVYWMVQNQPRFGKVLDKEMVTDILGLQSDDVSTNLPIEEVDTGIPFIMVPLKNIDACRRAKCDPIKNQALAVNASIDSPAYFVFNENESTCSSQYHGRMFGDYYGVVEDAATGSANGCLLAYLLKHASEDRPSLRYNVEQGIEMGRPSIIYHRGSSGPKGFEINIGGMVHHIASGHWD